MKTLIMNRQTGIASLLLICVVMAPGCTSTSHRLLLRHELELSQNEKIIELLLDNGTIVRFDEAGGRCCSVVDGNGSPRVITGTTWDKKVIVIDPATVLDAQVEKVESDPAMTMVFILLGLPAILIAIGVLLLLL